MSATEGPRGAAGIEAQLRPGRRLHGDSIVHGLTVAAE
jgi:hypothetical protein